MPPSPPTHHTCHLFPVSASSALSIVQCSLHLPVIDVLEGGRWEESYCLYLHKPPLFSQRDVEINTDACVKGSQRLMEDSGLFSGGLLWCRAPTPWGPDIPTFFVVLNHASQKPAVLNTPETVRASYRDCVGLCLWYVSTFLYPFLAVSPKKENLTKTKTATNSCLTMTQKGINSSYSLCVFVYC